MSRFTPRPIALENDWVRVEPLGHEHADALAAVAEPAVWTHMPEVVAPTAEAMHHWIDAALARSTSIPFAIISRADNRVAGSTRYLDIRPESRGLEIGYTWVAPPWQRSVVNTATKRLLIGHAFDDLAAIRVMFKTDARNTRSQQAIERIGATREGVMRHHMIRPDGSYRDSVVYSITDTEWPDVRAMLDTRLVRDSSAG